jgi:hypothetical protein
VEIIFSVFSVAEKRLNTEVTESLRPAPFGAGFRVLCVELKRHGGHGEVRFG